MPVDLNKLKAILGAAKKVMAKAEEIAPTKKQTKRVNESYDDDAYPSTPIYDERDEREPVYKTPDLSNYQPTTPKGYTAEQVMASNLPQVIKDAMIKNPIPQLSMPPSKFSLEDLGDLVEKPTARNKNIPLRESTSEQKSTLRSDMITISKAELKEMIDERVMAILVQNHNKNITEQAIKKTISTLINEGKLAVKKK